MEKSLEKGENHSNMNFRSDKLALTGLVVLAFFQVSRVSSKSVIYRQIPPEAIFPTVNDANEYNELGLFGEVDYASNNNNKCEPTTEPKPEIVSELAGGDYAKLGQFPWMAVVHRLAGGGRISMCGGTIISIRWILTAGHCVSNGPRKFFIVLGEINKSEIGYDFYKGQGIAMMTTQGALHPQYGTSVNDIALLKMPRDIKFSAAIKPIRLAGASATTSSFDGRTAEVVGWGRDGPQGSTTKRLKYISIRLMTNSMCARSWPMVDERNICTAAGTGEDACQGDSGGPLVVKSGTETLQVGVVSFGDGNCPSSRPAVFSRVSAFASWIEKVTGIRYE